MKKGGAAKGELVLAVFELANCFRHGWGIAKDPLAAKQVQSPVINYFHLDRRVKLCHLCGEVMSERGGGEEPVNE